VEASSPNRRTRWMQKTRSIHTKTIKNLLYSSFDYRKKKGVDVDDNKEEFSNNIWNLITDHKITVNKSKKKAKKSNSKCGSITMRKNVASTLYYVKAHQKAIKNLSNKHPHKKRQNSKSLFDGMN